MPPVTHAVPPAPSVTCLRHVPLGKLRRLRQRLPKLRLEHVAEKRGVERFLADLAATVDVVPRLSYFGRVDEAIHLRTSAQFNRPVEGLMDGLSLGDSLAREGCPLDLGRRVVRVELRPPC